MGLCLLGPGLLVPVLLMQNLHVKSEPPKRPPPVAGPLVTTSFSWRVHRPWVDGAFDDYCLLKTPFHMPSDFVCKHKTGWPKIPNLPQLVDNPQEPACWDRHSRCAPFVCQEVCMAKDLMYFRELWEPAKPGKAKVLVFQYGKVASSTIVIGLKVNNQIGALHTHQQNEAEAWLRGEATNVSFAVQGFALSREWSLQPGDKCLIITAARSHFSRDPSEYFENILSLDHPYGWAPRGVYRTHDTPPGPKDEPRWTQESLRRIAAENITRLVEDYKAQHGIVVQFYSKWFSEIFRKATGIDVLSEPFDQEKKYLYIEGDRCSALVLRYSDIGQWEQILSQFFPGFKMMNKNRGGDKWYSAAYKAFLKELKYTDDELEAMCGTETEMHFFQYDIDSPCRKLKQKRRVSFWR